MFGRQRTRNQIARYSADLSSDDPEIRRATASILPFADDQRWAVSALLAAMDEEPDPQTFAVMAENLAWLLWRDPEVREELDTLFADAHDSPADLVAGWQRWRAGRADQAPPEAPAPLSDEDRASLHADLRQGLDAFASGGWESAAQTRESLAEAIELVAGALRRVETAPSGSEQARRAEVTELLDRAGAHPDGSEQRDAVLEELLPDEDAPHWTDRRDVALAVDEALARCADPDPEQVRLGLRALRTLTAAENGGPADPAAVTGRLDALLAGPSARPELQGEVLDTYVTLITRRGGVEVPVDLFLEALDSEDPAARGAAALGTAQLELDAESETRAVHALTRLLDDPEPSVRSAATDGLAGLECADQDNAAAAESALAEQLSDPDAGIRAQVVRHGVLRGRVLSYAELVVELEDPDVDWRFVALVADLGEELDGPVPPPQARQLQSCLRALEEGGWAARDVSQLTEEERAALLTDALAGVC
ncbi:hypothetical protein QNO07_12210 [Streptomyces sp. 549]|uniref:hypothetical protein n=1 Tax=Streptomyces sp. 549 TaxID=3049076 RepID=UPI0024C37E6B|nr:hypothetical protein [Streptomyces sp. 549]MDK1474170.1 hypothetical protein [Streptomyces sp. 549]